MRSCYLYNWMQPLLKKFYQTPSLLVVKLLIITWAITKGLNYDLFTGDRSFPLAPVSDILLQVPAMFHLLLLWISLAAMMLFLFIPKHAIGWMIVGLELASCLLDQGRWQPWEYQFLFMMAAWLFLKNEHLIFTAWQLILVGIYFFSGLGKLQSGFIHDVWSGVMLRNWLGIFTTNENVFRLGYLLPLAEIAAALSLLTRRWRKFALVILICMHLLILLMFGPLGFNRNEVIWPWNVLMILLLFLLFFKRFFNPEHSFFMKPFSWLLIACFCLLPFLRLAGRWDNYLSFTMYSGGLTQLYICTSDLATLQKMSVYMGSTRNGMIPCDFPVSTYQWGMKAMNAAPYPQERVYRSIARQWKKKYPGVAVKFYLFTSGFMPTVREMDPDL